MRSEALAHQAHEFLEVAEFGHRVDHLAVLDPLQVLLQLPREGRLESGFELAQLFRVAPELLVVLALEKAAVLLVGVWPTLLVDLGFEPLFGCVPDGYLHLARAVEQLATDKHLHNQCVAAVFHRVQVFEDVFFLRRRLRGSRCLLPRDGSQ